MTTKKGDIKQRIINVSIALFAGKGFGSTSIREIASAASTTIPNIYYYFGSKGGLYNYVLRDAIARFECSMTEAAMPGASLREQLVAMGKAKHRFIAQNPNIMRLFFREQMCSDSGFELTEETRLILARFTVMMAEMVEQGMASGELRQVDPDLAASFLLGVFNAYDMGVVSLGHTPSDEEIEAIVDIALGGIKKR